MGHWFPRRVIWPGPFRPHRDRPGPLSVFGNLSTGRLGWLLASMNDRRTKVLTWWLLNATPEQREEAAAHRITTPVVLTHGWRDGYGEDEKMNVTSGLRLTEILLGMPRAPRRVLVDLVFKCQDIRAALHMHLKAPRVLTEDELFRRVDKDELIAMARATRNHDPKQWRFLTTWRAISMARKVPRLRDLLDVDEIMGL